MMSDNIMKCFLVVSQGGILQFINNTGQVDQVDCLFANGFTPSVAKLNRTFHGSLANAGHLASMNFHC
jgi:hypothetical protein